MSVPPARRVLALGLALSLALAAGPARAAPPERDLAYERGIQAETAGDVAAAAASFEQAYSLTAPSESGPRLLFLRASVAARLRAADGAPAQLCHARALLRDYLEVAAGDAGAGAVGGAQQTPAAGDASAEARGSLERVEQRLAQEGGPDCAALLGGEAAAPGPTQVPGSTQAAGSTAGSTQAAGSTAGSAQVPGSTPASGSAQVLAPAQAPAPAPAGPRPEGPAAAPRIGPTPAPADRVLRISGGVGLGVGAAGLVTMGVGIGLARQATGRGQALCWEARTGCTASAAELRDIVADGRRGDLLVRVGAVVGGLGVLAGAVLLALGERRRGRAGLSRAPRLTPNWAGLGLSGRF